MNPAADAIHVDASHCDSVPYDKHGLTTVRLKEKE